MKKSEKQVEFERHLEVIKGDYQRRIDALYILYPEFIPHESSPGSGEGKFNVTKAIRQILISHMGEGFNTQKMEEWIFTTYPNTKGKIKRVLISNTLFRMANKTKEIDILSSDRPVTYIKREDKKLSVA